MLALYRTLAKLRLIQANFPNRHSTGPSQNCTSAQHLPQITFRYRVVYYLGDLNSRRPSVCRGYELYSAHTLIHRQTIAELTQPPLDAPVFRNTSYILIDFLFASLAALLYWDLPLATRAGPLAFKRFSCSFFPVVGPFTPFFRTFTSEVSFLVTKKNTRRPSFL
ncbi:hypothetical protein DPMN_158170 [Dreissena polymorpha]|uniref:Uncharacterized protein n=1 Tax=Dreissena polymorpha TaxID=45954 RepID=A0A9D4EHE2_DREPO|nr:hypothetical protein DPMN_158170 [Dreissena polymorpha]